MRCPKCQYLAFEASDRCRNCGYDFSLLIEPEAAPLDVEMRDQEEAPLSDLVIRELDGDDGSRPKGQARRQRAALADGGRPRQAPVAAPDLPLFTDRPMPEPVLAPPRPPRAPLAVRRNTPEPVRLRPARPQREAPALDLEPELDAREAEIEVDGSAVEAAEPIDEDTPGGARASRLARLAGGIIDAIIICGVDIAVIYFTLQIVGLGWLGIFSLPPMPLFGFFLVLNGGYLAAFTAASGQTVGKMLAGVRVVQQNGRAVGFGQAMLRTAAYAVSILPFGLGFVPALIGPRLALHDRLAGTQVVKAA